MTPEVGALARHRLARARETFAEGQLLLATGALPGAVNRFYYAALYAARALLATREVDSSKHSGVIALFQQHFVRTGVVGADVARALPRAFEKRLTADYGDFAAPDPADVRLLEEGVAAFLEESERVLNELVPAPPNPES